MVTRGRLAGHRRGLDTVRFSGRGGGKLSTDLRMSRHKASLVRRYAAHHRRMRVVARVRSRSHKGERSKARSRLTVLLPRQG